MTPATQVNCSGPRFVRPVMGLGMSGEDRTAPLDQVYRRATVSADDPKEWRQSTFETLTLARIADRSTPQAPRGRQPASVARGRKRELKCQGAPARSESPLVHGRRSRVVHMIQCKSASMQVSSSRDLRIARCAYSLYAGRKGWKRHDLRRSDVRLDRRSDFVGMRTTLPKNGRSKHTS